MLVNFLGAKEVNGGTQLFFKEYSDLLGEDYIFDVMCDNMPITCFGQSSYDYLYREAKYLVEVTQKVGETVYIQFSQYFSSLNQARTLFELLRVNNSVTVELVTVSEYSLDDIPYKGTIITKVHEQTRVK